MSVLATDDFTRADSADLGTSWDVLTAHGSWKIVSNQAQPGALSGVNRAEINNAATWPNDQYSQAVVAGIGSGMLFESGLGLVVRGSASAETCYFAFTTNDPTNCNVMYKVVTGSYTNLGSNTTSGVLALNDVLYFEVQGTTLIYKRNGTQIFSVTDNAIASGRPGILLSTDALTAPILDTWEGGDFSAGRTTKNARSMGLGMQHGQELRTQLGRL